MKICMVNPPRVGGRWIGREDKHAGAGREEVLPYTAPQLYALIKRELPDADLRLIEAQRDNLSAEDVVFGLKRMKPDIVISLLSWTHIPWDRVCAETGFPTIAVILQQFVDQREAVELYNLKSRYVVKQELEMPIADALKEFNKTGSISRTKGFLVRTENGLVDTGDAEPADISGFPVPAFDAFDPDKYYALRKANRIIRQDDVRVAHFNTMKGCLFKCRFCGQADRGQRVRYQTVGRVIEQIELFVNKYKVNNFIFFDNEFGGNMKRAKEICKEIIVRGLKIRFMINNRVEFFDDELIDLLAASGCETVRLGIETCDPRLQNYMNKKIDPDKAKTVIKKLKAAGIKIHLYMMAGIPGETKKSLNVNARFIADADPSTFSATVLFPMPNSAFYNELKASGKLIETDWSSYRAFDRISYMNESYKSTRELKAAQRYMRRRAYAYTFINRMKRGSLDIRSLYRSIKFWHRGSW